MQPHPRPSVPEDATYLAPRLRTEDVDEVTALGHSPLEALQSGLNGRICLSIVNHGGEVVGMCGINHDPEFGPEQANVWLLASPGLVTIQREFMRQTRPVLDGFHESYPLLWNIVDARNEVHIRWLRYFGFTFLHLHPHVGTEGLPFYEFVRIPPHV